MRIVIFGAGGFLGQNLIRRYLEKKNVKIIGVVRNKSKKLIKQNKQLEYKHCDVKNFKKIKSILKKNDFVYHFAAPADLNSLYIKTRETLITYFKGTINITQACIEKKVKKLLILSSQEIYRKPQNIYSIIKYSVDLLLKGYSKLQTKLEIVIMRSSNIYGQMQSTKHIVPRFISRALQGKNLEVYGTQKIKKSYIHVDDLIDIFFIIEKKKLSLNQVINVSNGSELLSPIDIADIITNFLNIKKKYVPNQNKVHLSILQSNLKYKNDYRQKLKIKKVLQFKSLKYHIEDLVKHYSIL